MVSSLLRTDCRLSVASLLCCHGDVTRSVTSSAGALAVEVGAEVMRCNWVKIMTTMMNADDDDDDDAIN